MPSSPYSLTCLVIFVGQEQYSGLDMEFANRLGSRNLTSDLELDVEMDKYDSGIV